MSVIFIKASNEEAIARTAARLEGKIRTAFLRAVRLLRDQVTIDQLVKAIESGDIDQAMAMLAIDTRFTAAMQGVGLESNIQSVRSALQETFAAGAATAELELPRNIGVNISFNLFNPETVKFLDQYTMPLIRELSRNTRDAVRDVVTQAFKEGGHPYEQARKIKQFIGLTAHQTKAVSNYRAALSSSATLHRTLNRALRDGRYDRSVHRAVRTGSGLSTDQIDTMTARYQARYIQHRAQTIARTESIRASNKGQRALWSQAKAQGLLSNKVKRVWVISGDDRTCPICLSLDGEVRGLDEEFDDGIMDPPDPHSDCRCSTALVFEK